MPYMPYIAYIAYMAPCSFYGFKSHASQISSHRPLESNSYI